MTPSLLFIFRFWAAKPWVVFVKLPDVLASTEDAILGCCSTAHYPISFLFGVCTFERLTVKTVSNGFAHLETNDENKLDRQEKQMSKFFAEINEKINLIKNISRR